MDSSEVLQLKARRRRMWGQKFEEEFERSKSAEEEKLKALWDQLPPSKKERIKKKAEKILDFWFLGRPDKKSDRMLMRFTLGILRWEIERNRITKSFKKT